MSDTQVEGQCVGGPMDGKHQLSRFQKGFLCVDKPGNRVWIYDWDAALKKFIVRAGQGSELNKDRRLRAAFEGDYDVVAAPWITTKEEAQ